MGRPPECAEAVAVATDNDDDAADEADDADDDVAVLNAVRLLFHNCVKPFSGRRVACG